MDKGAQSEDDCSHSRLQLNGKELEGALIKIFAPPPLSGLVRMVLAMAALCEAFPLRLVCSLAATAVGPPTSQKDWQAARAELERHVVPVHKKERSPPTLWRMRTSERRRIIAQLIAEKGGPEVLKRISKDCIVNPILSGYLCGELNPARSLTADQLRDNFRAFEVLRGAAGIQGLPTDEAEAESRLGRADMIGRLKAIAGEAEHLRPDDLQHRCGSDALEDLRECISQRSPLVITGAAGVGKSTLLARYLLDEVLEGEVPRFPFAYLSFCSARLSIAEPVSLLYEALGQFSDFYPALRASLQETRVNWAKELMAPYACSLENHGGNSCGRSLQLARFVSQFCAHVQGLVKSSYGGSMLLLVLDQFEREQAKGTEHVVELHEFFVFLRDSLRWVDTDLRILVAGRNEIRELCRDAVIVVPASVDGRATPGKRSRKKKT